MVELVDTRDLKSLDHCGRTGSSPVPGTFSFRHFLTDKTLLDYFLTALFAVFCSINVIFFVEVCREVGRFYQYSVIFAFFCLFLLLF